MTLGELKALLEMQNLDKVCENGFCNPHSHRGFYNHVSFSTKKKNVTIRQLLHYVNEALSFPFDGWKGGEYHYDRNTIVHFAEEGTTHENDDIIPNEILESITNSSDIIPVFSSQISKFPDVEGEQDLWAVWNNTDLTEGRGSMYVQYVCEAKATALRLAKKAGIQGCNADVIPVKAYLIDKNWYYRGKPISPNEPDKKEEKRLKEEQELKEKREKVLKKAIELGLSQTDIEILRGLK